MQDPAKVDALRSHGALNPRPDEVRDELFTGKEFFDPRDLVQVKYEMLRQVLVEERAVAESAAAFGFSRPSFYRIQASYAEQGLPGLLPRRRGPQGPHKVTAEIRNYLGQTASEQPELSHGQLAELVEQRFEVSLHPRTIARALVADIKKNG